MWRDEIEGGYLEVVSRMEEFPRKKDGTPDWSRVDYRAAQTMARRGWYANGIKEQIMEHSPYLKQRKGRNMAKYVTRTVDKALDGLPGIYKFGGDDFGKDLGWKD